MAAGIVYHNITTSAGVTFALAGWVPDTGSPNVGVVPVSRSVDENLAVINWAAADSVSLLLENTHPTTPWNYTSGATNICVNTTTAVTIKTADASLRNYVDGLTISHPALGAASVFSIRDGASGTVLWAMQLNITTPMPGLHIRFPPGVIRSTAATLLEVLTHTATVTGGVCLSVSGHVAA